MMASHAAIAVLAVARIAPTERRSSAKRLRVESAHRQAAKASATAPKAAKAEEPRASLAAHAGCGRKNRKTKVAASGQPFCHWRVPLSDAARFRGILQPPP